MLTNLFKRSGIYFSGLVASKIVTFIVYILLARHFFPEKFGEVVFFMTLLQTVTVAADFGLNQWYQKRADFENKKMLFLKITSARLFTLLISIVLSFIVLWQAAWFSMPVLLLFIIALVPEAFVSITDGYYLEKKQSLRVAIKGASKMIVVLLGFFLMSQSLDVTFIIIFYIFGSALTALWSFPWLKVSHSSFSLNSVFKTLKESGAYATLILTSFAYARGDSLIIRIFLNNTALGLYGSAYRYLESLSLLPTALSHNLFPISAKREGITWHHLKKMLAIVIPVGLITSIFLYATSDFLIIGILGEAYKSAVPVMQIFTVVLFLFFINAPLNTVVISSDHLHKFVPWGIANTILNLVLNILLIPFYGIIGAAVAMLVTELTGLLMNVYFVKKKFS